LFCLQKITRTVFILNLSGGVLDIFYPTWKMKIATNEKLFLMTCQLWKETYCHSGESLVDVTPCIEYKDNSFMWHPYEAFDCSRGYVVSWYLKCTNLFRIIAFMLFE
jgi:hypothetical protein